METSWTPGVGELGFIVLFLGLWLVALLLPVIAFWKICAKAGFPGPLSLLMLVPFVNIIFPLYIAFTEWPALRDQAALQNAPTRQKNDCLIIGLVVGAVAILMIMVMGILAAILLPALARAREAARRASCANNLKQMGLVYKMFANENRQELYPELSDEAGRLMFSLYGAAGAQSVYPVYFYDLQLLLCPSDSDHELGEEPGAVSDPELLIDDHSYFYLGYVVTNDRELAAFAEAYKTHVAGGKEFLDDLPVPEGTGTAGGDAILRIREGVERFMIGDPGDLGGMARAQSDIPIMIERPENHVPGGGNVLYLDGHVEFVHYPGEWPMTEETIAILESLDAL